MKQKKFSVLHRITLYIFLVCLLLFLVLGFIAYRHVSMLLLNETRTNSMSMAETVAADIDGDIFNSIQAKGDASYQEVYRTLSHYKSYGQMSAPYLMRMDGDSAIFIMDLDPDQPAAFGESYNLLPDMLTAFYGKLSCDSKVTVDKWGESISAYAPIRASNKSVVGIACIDVYIDSFNSTLRILRLMFTTCLFFFAVITVGLYFFLSNNLTRLDPLTEIPNNNWMMKKGSELSKKRELVKYTALLVNIRDFRFLNNQYGYEAGNEILSLFANTLLRKATRHEYVARTGNDNFILLILKENTEQILKELEQIDLLVHVRADRKDSSSDKNEPVVNGTPVEIITENVHIPIRCGLYEVDDADIFSDVLNNCSIALNLARKTSGTSIVRFAQDMYNPLEKEREIVSAFDKALERHEFKVYYQPKVDINTGMLCGAEALVRWLRPNPYGMVSPGLFIPILEKEGLITRLDYYIFEEVCKDLSQWQKDGIRIVPVSSNFSKLHLKDSDFAQTILDILDRYGVDPSYLDVELTESSGYSDLPALKSFISTMKEHHVAISMDDFGTGYSSLSLLSDVEVDIVKIDKSFVDRIQPQQADADGSKMVSNVIHMISDLGRTVICEGVETAEQADFFRGTDCHIIQGYYFDKPMSDINFEERLKSPFYDK